MRESTITLLNQARSLLGQQDRWDDAIDLYTEVLDEQPSNAEALTYRAWLRYRSGEDPDEAIAAWEEALRLDPEATDAAVFGIIARSDLGRYDEAAEALDAIDLAAAPPEVAGLIQQRGIVGEVYGESRFDLLDDPDEAPGLDELDLSIDEALAAAGYLVNSGRAGGPVAALKLYEAITDVDPTNPAALSRRALILAQVGELDQAATLLDQAVEAAPDDPEALLSRASFLAGRRRCGASHRLRRPRSPGGDRRCTAATGRARRGPRCIDLRLRSSISGSGTAEVAALDDVPTGGAELPDRTLLALVAGHGDAGGGQRVEHEGDHVAVTAQHRRRVGRDEAVDHGHDRPRATALDEVRDHLDLDAELGRQRFDRLAAAQCRAGEDRARRRRRRGRPRDGEPVRGLRRRAGRSRSAAPLPRAPALPWRTRWMVTVVAGVASSSVESTALPDRHAKRLPSPGAGRRDVPRAVRSRRRSRRRRRLQRASSTSPAGPTRRASRACP